MNFDDRTWIQNKLNAGTGELSDEDLRVLLGDATSTEADALAGITFVRSWLSRKSLVPLFEIAVSDLRSRKIREAAAEAIGHICDETTRQILLDALPRKRGTEASGEP